MTKTIRENQTNFRNSYTPIYLRDLNESLQKGMVKEWLSELLNKDFDVVVRARKLLKAYGRGEDIVVGGMLKGSFVDVCFVE